MTGTIRLVEKQTVFGFVPGVLTESDERRWYAAVRKACAGSQGCSIGSHDLIEMLYLDADKAAALGARRAPSGYWIGLRTDPFTLSAIQKGNIKSFDLNVSETGVHVRFEETPQQTQLVQHTTNAGIREREKPMCDHNNLPESVMKCLNADPAVLSKPAIEKALDDLANALREPDETFEQSLAKVTEYHEIGKQLYAAHYLAPATAPTVSKSDSLELTKEEVFSKISAEAEFIRRNQLGMSREMAIAKILEEQPDLYDAYMSASRA